MHQVEVLDREVVEVGDLLYPVAGQAEVREAAKTQQPRDLCDVIA